MMTRLWLFSNLAVHDKNSGWPLHLPSCMCQADTYPREMIASQAQDLLTDDYLWTLTAPHHHPPYYLTLSRIVGRE